MEEVSVIGLDLGKNVFQLHGARRDGSVAFRRTLSRAKLLSFFAAMPSCLVAMEACASAHHWARQIGALGHEVRLIAPIYVKPFVKRNKNDAADAEAIAEAASRPTMRFVAVKSVEKQAAGVAFNTRDLRVRQRTQAINAVRGTYGRIWRRRPQRACARRAACCGDAGSGKRIAGFHPGRLPTASCSAGEMGNDENPQANYDLSIRSSTSSKSSAACQAC